MELQLNRIASPLGEMLLVTDAQGTVWSLEFADRAVHLAVDFGERYSDVVLHERPLSQIDREIVEKVQAYFNGDVKALHDIAVASNGSEFQCRVWTALRNIPAGTTTTYGELALSLGFTDPRMAKEVGAAIGANPVAIINPCHRVIGKDGSLKGYRWGIDRKRKLLELESRALGFRLAGQGVTARA